MQPTLIALLIFAGSARSATVITFDDIPLGPSGAADVGTYYSIPQGIVFEGATATTPQPGFAHSGAQVAEACFFGEFCRTPIGIRFRVSSSTGLQKRLKVWVGFDSDNGLSQQDTVVLRAFNQTETKILIATAPMGPSSGRIPISIPLEIISDQPDLDHATLGFLSAENSGGVNNYLAVDDVEFEGLPPPPCNGAPIVAINSPADGALITGILPNVSGTVNGDSLPPELTLTLTPLTRPPNDLTPPLIFALPLSGSGSVRTFSQAVPFKYGRLSLTAVVRNDCGIVGQSAITCTFLPRPIVDRYNAEGGQNAAQALQWAGHPAGCGIAVFPTIAVALGSGSQTFVIRGLIFEKWKQWVAKKYHSTRADFCPRGEQFLVAAGVLRQDFGSGRIYAFTSTGLAWFVPQAFADAIDQLGGESVNGLPMNDPQECPAAKTWLFQQFVRDRGLPSTLEIKGDSPTLWVHRQGGDLSEMTEERLLDTVEATGTLSLNFPCDSQYGGCHVFPPTSADRVANAKAICHNTTIVNVAVEQRQWEPVPPHTDCDEVSVMGFVLDSHLAGEDLATTHRPYPCTFFQGGSFVSDWNFGVAPIHPYKYLLAQNNHLDLEIEFCDLGFFGSDLTEADPAPGPELLQRGHLFWATGRWVIDCGHDNYASEIHPPAAMAFMRTEVSPTLRTVAKITVNGFYNGTPMSLDLFPPPRPAPNAFMHLARTIYKDSVAGMTVDYSSDPDASSFIRVSFSAPFQCPGVNTPYGGQMYPIGGRKYYGQWAISWDIDPTFQVSAFDY